MTRGLFIFASLVVALASPALPVAARHTPKPVTYHQPPDMIPAALQDEPGQVVAANCMACHSLDYITTQPRDKGAQFWRDEVTKMVNVYKAPIAPADADAIATTLGRKFGAT